jgi:hypothetical protein
MDEKIYNDELKVDLMKIKIDDNPDTEEDLKKHLLEATFIVPVEKKSKKEGEVDLVLLSDQNGEHYFQAYTDKESFEKWDSYEDYDMFTITFDKYAHALISGSSSIKGLVINPFTENVPLKREFIEYVFGSNKIKVEVIKDYPKKELKVIKEVLKEVKEVNKAYLFKMFKAGVEGYLLIVETDKESNKRIYDKIGNKVIKKIDQINLEIGDSKDPKYKEMLKGNDPIYVK